MKENKLFKENKGKILVSSLITLLPVLFGLMVWDKLPDTMFTHWGADGTADAMRGTASVVFGLPLIMLLLHFFCLFLTSLDKKQQNQNKKALGMIFWIVPITSLFSTSLIYAVSLGKEMSFELLTPAFLGLMFTVIGLHDTEENKMIYDTLAEKIN